eukprot:3733822-Amphidinium_carterae.1
MKDISHVGAMGQYGDDGSAYEEGSEQMGQPPMKDTCLICGSEHHFTKDRNRPQRGVQALNFEDDEEERTQAGKPPCSKRPALPSVCIRSSKRPHV